MLIKWTTGVGGREGVSEWPVLPGNGGTQLLVKNQKGQTIFGPIICSITIHPIMAIYSVYVRVCVHMHVYMYITCTCIIFFAQ